MSLSSDQYSVGIGAVVLTAILMLNGSLQGFAQSDIPASHQQMVSIGDSLARAGDAALHIVYVHGIGATGAGDSGMLRKSICDYLKDCTSVAGDSHGSDSPDQGVFAPTSGPPALTYLGEPIWNDAKEWASARPFVDHYVLARKHGKSILVDEINWWPLVTALKCRNILVQEAKLAGVDIGYLGDCVRYGAITPEAATELESLPSKSVLLNRKVKIGLMDWGFSDAMLAVGPLHELLIEGIRQLLMKSVVPDKDASNSEYIIITHSLGSFLIFSALNPQNDGPSELASNTSERVQTFDYLMAHMSQVYFFANQVPLLELARLGGSLAPLSPSSSQTESALAMTTPAGRSTYLADLDHWRTQRHAQQSRSREMVEPIANEPQIVAWSDPNDLLSWEVPDLSKEGINAVNLYPKNATRWLWLLEMPLAAHDNYAKNKGVIRALLNPKQVEGSR